MHWSLDQVRDLSEDEYTELIAWARKRAERSDDESIDMDAVTEAAKQARERKDG